MKQAKFTAFLMAGLMLSTLGLTSCGDDEDAEPMNKTQLLTRSEWKGDDLRFGGESVKNDSSVTMFFGDITTYRATYKADGTYTASAEDEPTEGTWMFMEDETKLMMISSEDQDTTVVNITTLTESELVMLDTDFDISLHYKH